MRIRRLILCLTFLVAGTKLIGCAPVQPYRLTNAFLDQTAVNELRAKRVAVLPFETTVSDYAASQKVTDEFNLQLGKLNRFELVERLRIEELYKEQDLAPNRIDQATAVKIGRMLGAHGVILGSVFDYNRGKIGISVKLVNVETGKQIWQARDTLYGTDPRVKALVQGWRERWRLKRDKEFLAQILCQLLAESFNQ